MKHSDIELVQKEKEISYKQGYKNGKSIGVVIGIGLTALIFAIGIAFLYWQASQV